MELVKGILFLMIAFTCITFFYYLRKNQVVEKRLKEVYEAIDVASVKRVREARNNLLTDGIGSRSALYKLYVYSGMSRKISKLSFELWTSLIIIVSVVLYFGALLINRSFIKSAIIVVCFISCILLMEKILALKNYKAVDNNLIKFLNLLDNFSVTNIAITSVFHQISRYLENPLSQVLDECYYEAQTSGDVSVALYAMADKIEHPKFKEIICNLEICMHYAANHTETINMSRKIILDEQRARKERKALASEFSFNMLIITGLLVAGFVIVDMLIVNSIWSVLFETVLGQICIAIIALIYIFFWYKMLTVER